MADDRGGYGTVPNVLLDGPDYQELPPGARHVFLVLKLTSGPSGLIVEYPTALVMRLAAQTGMSLAAVTEALDVLENEGHWIERERNILWIIAQLRYHPHFQPGNEKHQKAAWKRVQSLPRLPIVRRFVDAYPEYFGNAPADIIDALPAADAAVTDRLSVGYTDLRSSPVQTDAFSDINRPAYSPHAQNGKVAIDNGLAGSSHSLSHSLADQEVGSRNKEEGKRKKEDVRSNLPERTSPAGGLALEIGEFCMLLGCEWKLRKPIDEWAHEIRCEARYAGLDHAYEVRRCAEWHDANRKKPKAPDRSIRNWLERAADIAKRQAPNRTGVHRTTTKQDYGEATTHFDPKMLERP